MTTHVNGNGRRGPDPSSLRLDGVVCPPEVCRRVAGPLTRWLRQLLDDGMHVDPDVMAWVEAVRAEARDSATQRDTETGRSEYPDELGVEPLPHGIDAQEAARRLGCSRRNVTALARRGSLPGRHVGGRWLFDPEDVDQYWRQRD